MNFSNRAANVVANGPVECLTLNRRDFEQLMGPCEEIIKRNASKYKSIDELIDNAELKSNQSMEEVENEQIEIQIREDLEPENTNSENTVNSNINQEDSQKLSQPQHNQQKQYAQSPTKQFRTVWGKKLSDGGTSGVNSNPNINSTNTNNNNSNALNIGGSLARENQYSGDRGGRRNYGYGKDSERGSGRNYSYPNYRFSQWTATSSKNETKTSEGITQEQNNIISSNATNNANMNTEENKDGFEKVKGKKQRKPKKL